MAGGLNDSNTMKNERETAHTTVSSETIAAHYFHQKPKNNSNNNNGNRTIEPTVTITKHIKSSPDVHRVASVDNYGILGNGRPSIGI
jgi:hypothetical protein